MRAARLHQPGGPIHIEEIEVPKPGPGEVLVRTEACGLCHSDLFIRSLDQLPRTPLTLGHESVGFVDQVGAGVEQVAPGDRVAVTFLHSACGECEFCRASRPELCPRQLNTGYHADGAFAAYVTARAGFVVPVPAGLDAVQAAPLCCAGWTAFHAIKTAGLGPGSWLAIFGVGGLGQLGVQFARLAGLRVAAIDVSPEKLGIAQDLGAELTVNAAEQDPARTLRKAIGGAHGAISFVASAGAIRGAFGALRRAGVLVLVGLANESFDLPLVEVVLKAARVQGSFLGRREELPQIFELARSGQIKVETEACSLDELPAMMRRMEEGKLRGRAVVRFG